MKFPRQTRLLTNPLEAAPIAGVCFLFILFMVLWPNITRVPGLAVTLPDSSRPLPGMDRPTVAVTLDQSGQIFFSNQLVSKEGLRAHLKRVRKEIGVPTCLVVEADRLAAHDWIVQIAEIAKDAGIETTLLGTRPALFNPRNTDGNVAKP
ncbi:MAG: biopolymer transporter ExbD [Pedosphaera sp.]|nr:biopolymer transporter ExbD [Pedosphaera sp.]MSU40238.1 biopolymer transporter ExbD [Pedosphaera sp.]